MLATGPEGLALSFNVKTVIGIRLRNAVTDNAVQLENMVVMAGAALIITLHPKTPPAHPEATRRRETSPKRAKAAPLCAAAAPVITPSPAMMLSFRNATKGSTTKAAALLTCPETTTAALWLLLLPKTPGCLFVNTAKEPNKPTAKPLWRSTKPVVQEPAVTHPQLPQLSHKTHPMRLTVSAGRAFQGVRPA